MILGSIYSITFFTYSLTAPAVSPDTIYFCIKIKIITIGIIRQTPNARILFHCVPYFVWKLLIIVVIGQSEESEIKAIEYTRSFHAKIKEKIAAVARPGRETGTIILTNAPNIVHPSTLAASSTDLGRDAKKGRIRITINGIDKVAVDRIGAILVLMMCILVYSKNNGVSSKAGGNICVTRNPRIIGFPAFDLNRASP